MKEAADAGAGQAETRHAFPDCPLQTYRSGPFVSSQARATAPLRCGAGNAVQAAVNFAAVGDAEADGEEKRCKSEAVPDAMRSFKLTISLRPDVTAF